MRLTAFQSEEGDCLLLETTGAKHRMLIDGGMARAYSEHVAPAMGALRKAGKMLDIVYISHIDADHISGVLQMLDDEAAWRVHEPVVTQWWSTSIAQRRSDWPKRRATYSRT